MKNSLTWKPSKKRGGMVLDWALRQSGLTEDEFLRPKRMPFLPKLAETASALVMADWPVTIISDFDADGVLSACILASALEAATGTRPEAHFIRRFTDGYGNFESWLPEIRRGTLVLTDHGIASAELVAKAKAAGLAVVVIDHHLKREDGILPEADALLDPHATGGEFKDYCAAGLCLRVAEELCPDSQEAGLWRAFAAIATVADVVPLVGDNRNIVRDGLAELRKGTMTDGMAALFDAMGVESPSEDDLGFSIAPAINAAGRLEDGGAQRVYDLLMARAAPDGSGLAALAVEAQAIKALNEERKSLVDDLVRLALEHPSCKPHLDGRPVVIALPETDARAQGIVGIVAGRLAEELRTPALVLVPSFKDRSVLKGSGRSYGGVHLRHLLDHAKDCMVGYGGHAGAAGVTVLPENVDALRGALEKAMAGLPEAESDAEPGYDFEASLKDAPKILEELELCGPFGEGNRKPRFLFRGFRTSPKGGKFWAPMGARGKAFRLNGEVAMPDGLTLDAVFFDGQQAYLACGEPRTVDIIGAPFRDAYRGASRIRLRGEAFLAEKPEEAASDSLLDELAGLLDGFSRPDDAPDAAEPPADALPLPTTHAMEPGVLGRLDAQDAPDAAGIFGVLEAPDALGIPGIPKAPDALGVQDAMNVPKAEEALPDLPSAADTAMPPFPADAGADALAIPPLPSGLDLPELPPLPDEVEGKAEPSAWTDLGLGDLPAPPALDLPDAFGAPAATPLADAPSSEATPAPNAAPLGEAASMDPASGGEARFIDELAALLQF